MAQGNKLAVGANGTARASRTVRMHGVELTENAAVIGVALETLDGKCHSLGVVEHTVRRDVAQQFIGLPYAIAALPPIRTPTVNRCGQCKLV